MTLSIKRFTAVLLGVFALSFALPSLADSWKLLGSKTANYSSEYDVIPVHADEGAFRRVKFVVRGAAVSFDRAVVIYGNGGRKVLPIRKEIPRGGQTVQFDLEGGKRIIREVRMYYKTRPGHARRANVQVWGIR